MSFELVMAVIALIEKGMDFVNKQKAIAAQTTEWTPEQRVAVEARMKALLSSPAWQPDPEL